MDQFTFIALFGPWIFNWPTLWMLRRWILTWKVLDVNWNRLYQNQRVFWDLKHPMYCSKTQYMQTVTLLARLPHYWLNNFSASIRNTLLSSSHFFSSYSYLSTPCFISVQQIIADDLRLLCSVSFFFGLISYLTQNTVYPHYKKQSKYFFMWTTCYISSILIKLASGWQIFSNSSKYTVSQKSFTGERSCSIRTGEQIRQTDIQTYRSE